MDSQKQLGENAPIAASIEADKATMTPDPTSYPDATPHLNSHGLQIYRTEAAGRGVFATKEIPAGTLLEVSPVLVFPAKEYEQHGRHTQLDSYTFIWNKESSGKSDMALALGLGER